MLTLGTRNRASTSAPLPLFPSLYDVGQAVSADGSIDPHQSVLFGHLAPRLLRTLWAAHPAELGVLRFEEEVGIGRTRVFLSHRALDALTALAQVIAEICSMFAACLLCVTSLSCECLLRTGHCAWMTQP
jgi:hypothetical protein